MMANHDDEAKRARRECLRDLRQGGTGATRWRWRKLSIPGRCEQFRQHRGTEHVARELYRGSHFEGDRNARGMPANGAIFNTGSLCGDCAIDREVDDMPPLSDIEIAHARRAGKTAAVFESVTGVPLHDQ